ncbi:MAG: hypothetical protein QOJ07_759 [Thermoleophilaceae bacterium]|jgi:hypothetical protein|nr:hypothetical protein [Thermoleophilaceae bacterium]
MRRSHVAIIAAVGAMLLTLPAIALGHAERHSYYPDGNVGKVPLNRNSGPSLVVCKNDSVKLIKRSWRGNARMTRKMLRIQKRCKFSDIQAAVDAAKNNYRILVMPGLYKEEPSRAKPVDDPACKDLKEPYGSVPGGIGLPGETTMVPSYEYQRKCPNAQNLIAIVGDGPDDDRVCDDKCNIEIEGEGKRPNDVLIQGDKKKLNIIRADRADGVVLENFTVEYSDFNNIYAIETNGFRFDHVISRFSREYGFLTFVSDHGIYKDLDASYSGDSGVYPGAGPEGHCQRYGIEIAGVNSHDNNLGYSGTAGNGVYAHDNKFHDNGTGIATDSFVPNHPGMPQDCAKWENNEIYSNNKDLFNADMDHYCQVTPYAERDPRKVCSTFQNPVGTGLLIAGGDGDIAKGNYIYDNWRNGITLLWVPATLRGDNDPSHQYDVSNDNSFTNNHMGLRPDGTRDPNGKDFYWDEEGKGNCWQDNQTAPGESIKSDPATLPKCPGGPFSPGMPAKTAMQASCATWDPMTNTDPPGCDWFTVPPEPK